MIHLPLCLFLTGSTEGASNTGSRFSVNHEMMVTLYRFETILYGPLGRNGSKALECGLLLVNGNRRSDSENHCDLN
jgi:hypothetical protein